jgi:FMN hydrolase / 5-amino-6-(5-phospho-D-ribitylamino)uracil phosphatase
MLKCICDLYSYCLHRPKNVEAAAEVGIKGVHFKNVDLMREELSLLGIDISTDEDQ